MVSNVQQEDDEREPFWWDHAGWEMTFVENMRMLRERRGMSQSEFARKASERSLTFHQPTVQRIERGERPLKLTEALVIAEILGSSLEQMMNDVSLPFAHAVLVRSASWPELESSIERVRGRGVSHQIEVLTEHLEDYLAAAERFGENPRKDAIARAEKVRAQLQRIQAALDTAMETVDQVAAELAKLPAMPEQAHGGTPWDDRG